MIIEDMMHNKFKGNNEIEVKKLKLESLVRKINDAHYCADSTQLKLLRLVFEYDKLNEYGKIIVDEARFKVPSDFYSIFGNSMMDEKEYEVFEVRQRLTKKWVDYCIGTLRRSNSSHMEGAFYFILCALMIVTVDNNNKEGNLSSVCDFARMLMITDDEIKDMITLIKIMYGKLKYDLLQREECDYIKTERSRRAFSNLLYLYKNEWF